MRQNTCDSFTLDELFAQPIFNHYLDNIFTRSDYPIGLVSKTGVLLTASSSYLHASSTNVHGDISLPIYYQENRIGSIILFIHDGLSSMDSSTSPTLLYSESLVHHIQDMILFYLGGSTANESSTYHTLLERMNHASMVIKKSFSPYNKTAVYRVVDANTRMRQIAAQFGDHLTENQPVDHLKTVRYLLKTSQSISSGESKKTIFCSKTQQYYTIEWEYLNNHDIFLNVYDLSSEKKELQHSHKQRVLDIVSAMSKLIEKRDLYTYEHQRNVAVLAVKIATYIGLDIHHIENVFIAALLHDIGKSGIPSEILTKPDVLSPIEYELMKTHVEKAYEILNDFEFHRPIAEIVRQHHERIDGSGYPLGLNGDKMLIESKILAVADVYEAITAHRPYRPSLGARFAKEHLIKGKDTLYDGTIVDACLHCETLPDKSIDDIYRDLFI